MDSSLLTVAETGAMLRCGKTTVYEYLTSGDLPSLKIGRLRRIPRAAVETFIEERLAVQAEGVVA